MSTDTLGRAVHSVVTADLLPFPTPAGTELPPELARAIAAYETIRAEHAKATEHRRGTYQRTQEAQRLDVEAVRAGEEPHHEADVEADQQRTLLLIESLQGQAREAEAVVRKVAAEVAERYRAELAQQSEQLRQAVEAGVEAIRARLIELRTVAGCEVWLDQVTTPGVRVKALGVDVSGIDESLQPVQRLLAGPSGGGDIGHYLNNLRQGDSGQAFTIPIGSVSNRG